MIDFLKKSILFALCCVAFVIAGLGTAPALADDVEVSIFGKDSGRDEYIDAFGWDPAKMEADSWTVNYYIDSMYYVASENGFGEETLQYLVKKYPDYYIWDEALNSYVNDPTIDFEDLTDPVEFHRKSDYTLDYYADMVETTKEYLDLKEAKYFGGGAAMAAVARAEVGAPGSWETPMGSNNVKYNTWYYGHEVAGYNYQWCDVFITWCANQCGYLESGYGEGLDEPLYSKAAGAGCSTTYRRFVGEMGFDHYPTRQCYPYVSGGYIPVPGDLVLFSKDSSGSLSASYEHIGIVVEVKEDCLVVVEGNCSNKVTENNYTMARMLAYTAYHYSQIIHVEYPETNGAIGVYNFLRSSLGLNDAATVGVMMSMDNESHITADKLERTYTQGFGLCGWTDSDSGKFYRWGELRTYCIDRGYKWNSFEGQLWFLQYEMEEGAAGHNARYRECYQKLLEVPDTLEGAKTAANIWSVYHQGGGTFSTPSGYAQLMQRRITAYNAWPDVQGWAEDYENGRSDHELAELGWAGTLFVGTENWTGQRRDLSAPPTHWF